MHAGRQDLGFPCGGRRLVALELRYQRGYRIGSVHALAVTHVLPPEQEAHEVCRRHRFDFVAQPLHRVAVDAREQAPVAPFGGLGHAGELPAHGEAFRLEREQRATDMRFGHVHLRRHLGGGSWPDALEPAAHDLDQRGFAFPDGRVARRLQDRIGFDIAHHGLPFGQALRGDPQPGPRHAI